ncbi:hypothetical protein NGB58_26485, partial [Escherichia coli]|nr:hypothetical protein [Escherichia coli]
VLCGYISGRPHEGHTGWCRATFLQHAGIIPVNPPPLKLLSGPCCPLLSVAGIYNGAPVGLRMNYGPGSVIKIAECKNYKSEPEIYASTNTHVAKN